MIHRKSFENDYNHFWSLSPPERTKADGSLVALFFVMLAMGTQFVDLPSPEEKEQTAEFYSRPLTLPLRPDADESKYLLRTKLYGCSHI